MFVVEDPDDDVALDIGGAHDEIAIGIGGAHDDVALDAGGAHDDVALCDDGVLLVQLMHMVMTTMMYDR